MANLLRLIGIIILLIMLLNQIGLTVKVNSMLVMVHEEYETRIAERDARQYWSEIQECVKEKIEENTSNNMEEGP